MEALSYEAPAVWSGRPSWSTYLWLWIFVGIFGIRAVASLWMGYWSSLVFHLGVIGMLSALAVFLRRTTHYRLTRQAVYRSKGILGTSEQSFPLGEIGSVSQQQGPLERLFRSGTVILHLKTGSSERLAGIKDPEVLCNKIRAIL